MRVTVTEAHIRHSTPEISQECPVALAVNDRLESEYGAYKFWADAPGNGLVEIYEFGGGSGPAQILRLPEAANVFIERSDHSKKVAPFKFTAEDTSNDQ